MIRPTVIMVHDDDTESYLFGDRLDQLINLSTTLTKTELEEIQKEHYKNAAASNPHLAFDECRIGNDPPDFIIQRGGKNVSLDLAAFSFSDKRGSAIRFKTVQNAVREAFRAGRLNGLKDIGFMVTFAENRIPGDTTLHRTAIPEFIKSIAAIAKRPWSIDDFPEDWTDTPGAGPFPMDQSGTSSDGILSWYVIDCGFLPPTNEFAKECGFRVETGNLQSLSLQEISERLMEIVKKHDKPEIEELLIVAGGPNRHGEGYSDEATFALFFCQKIGKLSEIPRHLQRVIIDNWRTGSLHIIFDRESINLNLNQVQLP